MELAYLWIYNILGVEQSGLNFSDQFRFKESVDEDKKEFIINVSENENYIEDFFGNKVCNVTAIVGKNGTGKSNLLDEVKWFLSQARIYSEFLIIYKNKVKKEINCYYSLYDDREDNQWKVTFRINGSLSYKVNKPKKEKRFYNFHQEPLGLKRVRENKVIYYSPFLDYRNYPYNNTSPEFIDISTNFLIVKDSEGYYGSNYKQLDHHYFKNVARQFQLFTNSNFDHSEFNFPTKVEIRFEKINREETRDLPFDSRSLYEFFSKEFSKVFQYWNSEIEKAKKNKEDVYEARIGKIKTWFLANLYYNYFDLLAGIKDLNGDVFKIRLEDLDPKENLSSNELINYVREIFINQKWKVGDKIILFIDRIFKILDQQDILLSEDSDNESYFISDLNTGRKVWDYYYEYSEMFQTDRGSKNSKILNLSWAGRNLSSGEKAMYDLYSRLIYAFELAEKPNTNIIYLLLDEGEVGFHPEWQRLFLSKIIKFIDSTINTKVHVILTTHSPFILSDLPSNNVIFLNKNNSEFAEIVNNPSATFGANIHELFKDSFFLEKGFMGEFAKSKITDLISYLSPNITTENNERNFNKNIARRLINLVGEPLLKERLDDLFREKFPEEYIEEESFLHERIKILQEENKRLRNEKDNNR